MARKLKGFNIKGFFADHSEKLALVIVLGMVAMGLASTNWVPYQRAPSEFTAKVDDARANIAKATWPEEEREKFILQEDEQPHRIVDAGINDRIPVMPYFLQSQSQWKDKDARDDPLLEPSYRPVVDMEVSDARVLIHLAPKFEEEDQLASADQDGTTGGTGAGSLSQVEENTPDEFLSNRGGAGLSPGFGGGDETMPFGAMGAGRRGRDYDSMMAPELLRGAAAGRGGSRRGRGRRGDDAAMLFADADESPATGRRGRNNRRDRRRSSRGRAEAGDEVFGTTAAFAGGDEDGMGGMYGGMEEDGKGYPFVSVRGVFEFREQIRLYSEAIHKPASEAMQHFMIVDFQLERQRLATAPDEWTDWEPVNDQVFRDILKEAIGFDPEVVNPAVTDAAITCPLPARLTGMYSKQATHSRLKEYALSPEEMEKEIEYQQLVLKNVLEKNKPPEGLIVKKGFADMVFDARSVNQSFFGTSSAYAGMAGAGGRYADDDGDEGGFGGMRGPMMGTRGPAGVRGMAGQNRPDPMLAKTIEQLALEMSKREEGVESKESVEELKKWITARAMPEGDLLLFRYFDFDVEPGQTYRYRVRLELQNPNYGAPLAATGGVASVIDGPTRMTPWSEPTDPIRVNETVNYFLTAVEPPRSLVHPQARMNIFQYDLDVGTVVQDELDVAMGQNVGGKSRTEQADPAKGIVDDVDYTFKSNDVLVDVVADYRFSRSEHPDLQLPTDSRGLAQIAEIAAVVTPHGEIKTIDQVSQEKSLEQAKRYKELQDDNFAHLTNPNDAAGAVAGGYGYGDDDDAAGMISQMMMSGAGNRGLSPLRRGGGGKNRR